jgi:hypothetical protein
LTRRVQSKDLPTWLVVGHSGAVIVAEAAETVGLGGDDRGRYERTDARLAPDKREPLAANVAAVKEPTGVMAKLAAVETGDVEGAEARDGPAKMREHHAGHPAKRGGLVPPEHTGVAVAGMLISTARAPSPWRIVTPVTVVQLIDLAMIQLQSTFERLSPNTLFGEAVVGLLNPETRALGPIIPSQMRGAIMGAPLPFDQSLILIWPQVTGLIAGMIVVFAAAYVVFPREEIRA